MLRVELEPGFILHHRPFRDTSLLLEAFSRDHGRVGLVARGARGPRSRWKGTLQPFRALLLSWQLRGELGTLTGAEPAGRAVIAPAGALVTSGSEGPGAGTSEVLLGLYYLNELLLRLTARLDPHPVLFGAYAAALQALAGGAALAPELRRFEKALLDQLGYGPELGHDAAGQVLDPAASYRYEPSSGLRPCRPETPGALLGSSLHDLAAGRLEAPRALADARRLLRAALDAHLEGRPLKTREMLARLRGSRAGPETLAE